MKIGLIADDFSVERSAGLARYSQEILRGLRTIGFEVNVISHMPPNIPFGEAINHTAILPYSVLKRANHFDVIHATAPITGLCFPFIKKPKVMTYHDLHSMLSQYSGNSLHARLFSPLFFKIGKYSDMIIAVSTQTKDELITYLKIPEDKITVINEGVDERFKPLEKKDRGHRMIGYLGALASRKRIDYLIRAFSCLRIKHPQLEVKLSIYGKKIDVFPQISRLVKELNLCENVEFHGIAPDEKLVEIYNSFDVFVLPSEWEGFGLPILEAQKCGVPVVIRDNAHIPQETAACCLKAISEEDMADKINELLTSPALRGQTIDKGLAYSKKFTWDKAAHETINVYEKLLQSKKSRS